MYGQTYSSDSAGGSAFTAGINENVSLISFSITNTDQWGQVLDVVFSKGASTVNCRKFQVDPSKVTPREISIKGVKKMQSEKEAVTSAFSEFNTWVKHIIRPFTTEEAFDAAIKAATATDNTFEGFINGCKSLLPEGFENQAGRLILTYNNKGFLEVPRAMWVTGAFWALDPERILSVSNKIVITRPEVNSTPVNNW